VDAALSPLVLACALRIEEKAARRAGARAARVGLGATLPLPDGRIVSFGLAGALVPDLPAGTLVTAPRVVDEAGATLWEAEPLAVPGAALGVICAARRIVDEPADRAGLATLTGAVAVEMESARLAESGRLAGVVRVVADTPERRLGLLARASTPEGGPAWGRVVRAFLREPRRSAIAARDARRALRALTEAARGLVEA
jgi:nucleoside phosphorylase